MPDEMHKLQKQPAEGSRKVIERELKRQDPKDPADKEAKRKQDDGNGGKSAGQSKRAR